MANIIDTAIDADTFKTLLAAIEAAGLVETLSGAGPFTLLAPTDEAFSKLPPGAVSDWLNDIPRLKSVLTYHVLAGKFMAAEVAKLTSAKTVNGQSVSITASEGVTTSSVTIDGAQVVKTDIAADNGVIHALDSVLMPK